MQQDLAPCRPRRDVSLADASPFKHAHADGDDPDGASGSQQPGRADTSGGHGQSVHVTARRNTVSEPGATRVSRKRISQLEGGDEMSRLPRPCTTPCRCCRHCMLPTLQDDESGIGAVQDADTLSAGVCPSLFPLRIAQIAHGAAECVYQATRGGARRPERSGWGVRGFHTPIIAGQDLPGGGTGPVQYASLECVVVSHVIQAFVL